MSELIGPYRIERELGRGGMGVVYVGVHTQLGRRAAVKVLLDPKVGEDRFWRECEGMSRLRHPGIVQIYEAGVHAGLPYMAMELVEGSSLKAVLATTGPWASRRAAELGVALSDAMAHVHAGGLLHRDLKPENVLIDETGRARITDFGLVRGVGTHSLTATGTMLGTPAFMPPEQADGEKKKLGPPSDVYGLGATLFAVLTGAPPFEGPSPYAIVAQLFKKPAPAPSSLQPGVDPALDEIVLRCLAKDSGDRYPDAAALAKVLRSYLAGELQGPPRSARPLLRGISAVVLVAIVLGGLVAWRVSGEGAPTPAPPTAEEAWAEAQGDAARISAWLEDYASADAELARLAREKLAGLTWADVPQPTSSEDLVEPDDPVRLSDYRQLAAWTRDHGDYADSPTRRAAQARQPNWSPGATPPILALLRGQPATRSKPSSEPFALRDERLLALGRKPRLKVWDLAGRPEERPLAGEVGRPARGAVYAGEEVLLIVGRELLRLDPGTLKLRQRVTLDLLYGLGVVPLPGGSSLVYGELKGKGTGGGWTLVPSSWPDTEVPLTKHTAASVRAGFYDSERGFVYLAGGSSDTGAKDYFLRRHPYAEGELGSSEEVALSSAGYHMRPLPEGRVLVGLNRSYAVIFGEGRLRGRPQLKLSLTNAEDSTVIDGLGYQCLGSLPLPGGGLLLSCDSYQKKENGWLAYFSPQQLLASRNPETILPRWIAPLPFRPRSLTQSADGSLIFLGTSNGLVAVLPRFKLR